MTRELKRKRHEPRSPGNPRRRRRRARSPEGKRRPSLQTRTCPKCREETWREGLRRGRRKKRFCAAYNEAAAQDEKGRDAEESPEGESTPRDWGDLCCRCGKQRVEVRCKGCRLEFCESTECSTVCACLAPWCLACFDKHEADAPCREAGICAECRTRENCRKCKACGVLRCDDEGECIFTGYKGNSYCGPCYEFVEHVTKHETFKDSTDEEQARKKGPEEESEELSDRAEVTSVVDEEREDDRAASVSSTEVAEDASEKGEGADEAEESVRTRSPSHWMPEPSPLASDEEGGVQVATEAQVNGEELVALSREIVELEAADKAKQDSLRERLIKVFPSQEKIFKAADILAQKAFEKIKEAEKMRASGEASE